MIDLRQGDCLELMKTIPDKSINMILCDLPYGVTKNKNDKIIPFDALWKEYERIIKDDGCIALFSQGKFYVDLVNSNKKLFRYDLIWDKVLTSGFLNANKMPLRQHEQIAIFYKNLPTYNPQKFIGNKNHGKGTPKENKNNNYGKYEFVDNVDKLGILKNPTSIIRFSKPHPSKSKHPTEKPVELLEYLIKTYTKQGDVVLDNCMGSGRTGIACCNTNRDFIGYEIDKTMFDFAKQEIEHIKNKEN